MQESRSSLSSQKQMTSITRYIDNDCCYQSKQSTCEEIYDQLVKAKISLRRQNHNLKRQIEQMKQNILAKTFANYFSELRQLSARNQNLREKHRVIYETKKPILKVESQYITKSPLKTPRSNKSNNIFPLENKNINSNIPRLDIPAHNRKSLNNSTNNQNIMPSNHMRKSLKISQAPPLLIRQTEQLTQRKMKTSNCLRDSGAHNISSFWETNSMRESVKSMGVKQNRMNENYFTNIVALMLEEEKEKQNQILEIITNQGVEKKQQQIQISDIEKQIEKATNNIQNLQQVLENYQAQIKKMHINLNSVTQMTAQLSTVKFNYIQMLEKCKNIHSLKLQVNNKSKKLKQLQLSGDAFQPPQSIKMMLRLFGVQEASLSDPIKCKNHLKSLVKGNIEKPNKKKVKIRELLETIKEGRKKFKQLLTIYEGRIKKLEKKIGSLRIHERK